MSIIIQDGWYVRGPFPADRKLMVGTNQDNATKEDIPVSYRFAHMVVLDADTGNRYRLNPDLTTWVLVKDVPDWVQTTQGSVTLANFGGNLEWSRIDNAPVYNELAPPTFSAVTIPAGDSAYVSGIHPNFTIGIPQGAEGASGTGPTGPPGAAATITVGTTTTGIAGSNASVANSGTAQDAVFDFTIPTGLAGPGSTIAVGSVATGSAGSSAQVTNSGTDSAAIFDFIIPRGDQGIQGIQGDQGIKGDTGDTGAQGPQGIQGIQGVKGDTGDTGATGSGVTILGSDTTANIIVKSGTAGDMWIATTTGTDDGSNSVAIGDGLVYDGADWLTVGPIRGPQGPQGETGAQGTAGADGADGATGATGATGAQGPQGIQGITGATGPTGPAGTNGTDGIDGKGWTGGSYNGTNGIVTFTSTDGLGFSTGDLRGADGVDGQDGANGSGTPAGGTVGQLLRKNSSTDWDASWWTDNFANENGDFLEYFRVNTLQMENIEGVSVSVEGEMGFDLNDQDSWFTPLAGAKAYTGTDPFGLYVSDGVTGFTRVWHEQHFGPSDVNAWQAHVDSPHAPADANNYAHPNHFGEVTSSGDGNTIVQKELINNRSPRTSLSSSDRFLFTDASDNYFLRRTSLGDIQNYMQSSLNFGTTEHGNHNGEILSTGLTTSLNTNATCISNRTAFSGSILSTDQLLLNDGGALRKLNMSTLRSYTFLTDAEIKAAVLRFDGPGSGINADLLDGQHSSAFALVNHTHPIDTRYLRADIADTAAGSITFTGSANVFSGGSNVTIVNDYHRIQFGTLDAIGPESEISSNGTNTTWNIKRNKFAFYDNDAGKDLLSVSKVTGNVVATGDFTAQGSIYALVGYETSDERLKNNVTPLLSDDDTGFKYYKFNWKKGGKLSYGALAQEVYATNPELVDEKDGVFHVNYSALLVKEIASLKARIDKLERINQTKL